MKKPLWVLAFAPVLLVPWVAPLVMAGEAAPSVDVIVQTDGSTDALVAAIESIGGTVRFQYRNVPAVAATVPVDRLAAVGRVAGVSTIEKDQLIYLPGESPGAQDPVHPMSVRIEDMSGFEVRAVDVGEVTSVPLPEGYANFLYTGALDIWGTITEGDGAIVAVVDTGTVPNVCLAHAVIGAPGFPDGYNSTGDGIAATNPANHWHGTHVGGVISSSCALDFSSNPAHPIYQAVATHLGWPVDFVPILGQAPAADLYPVKVFPADGGPAPAGAILDGLDHVLTLKKEGLLDVDIVNFSIGGPTLWDGRDAWDRFMAAFQEAGILFVTSAGNDGPTPNSVGSPATSFSALSVAALDYAPSSRTFYEYLGLAVWPIAPGQGLVMRPTDELRVVNYSARGPLSDGRFGPEISALGHWNFHVGPINELRWAGGTSFSSPTVAGAAALLDAWWEEDLGYATDPVLLENVLKLGADPTVVGAAWQGINDQGYGTLDIPASFMKLMDGQWRLKPAKKSGALTVNVLGKPVKNWVQTWESDTVTLDPSEPFNAVFEIGKYTSKVTIEVFDIDIPDNWAYAFWANSVEVHLQSAKRTAWEHPVSGYWFPWYGDSFDIVVEDGPWTVAGDPWAYLPMEPGLMKLTLIGDYSNEAQVSFRVRIIRENELTRPEGERISSGMVKQDEETWIPVEIPEGTSAATFDLLWHRDWSKFPTSDVDMYFFDPTFAFVPVFDGATGNAPERAILEEPMPGTWYVVLVGYELNKPDNYDLYLKLE